MRLHFLPRTLVLVACVLVAGCGEPSEKPPPKAGAAGSAGSDHAGSDGGSMNAGLAGIEVPPLSREEFVASMKENNSLMREIKVAVQNKDKAAAMKALDTLAANSSKAMGTKPEKNADRMAAYVALFGAQKMTAQGLKGLVDMETWGAMGPSMATLGKNCMACHKQFRLSPEELKARMAGGGNAPAPANPTPLPGSDSKPGSPK